jgi:hypothetical protein
MPRANYHLIDFVQQFRREQAHIIFERLIGVRRLIKHCVPEHFAQRMVLIDQLMQPVIILIQIQAHHAAHQDLPQRHTRPAIAFVHLRRQLRFQQSEDLVT